MFHFILENKNMELCTFYTIFSKKLVTTPQNFCCVMQCFARWQRRPLLSQLCTLPWKGRNKDRRKERKADWAGLNLCISFWLQHGLWDTSPETFTSNPTLLSVSGSLSITDCSSASQSLNIFWSPSKRSMLSSFQSLLGNRLANIRLKF